MSKTAKQITGNWGEQAAARFLIAQGYKIFARNFEVILNGKKRGEIDIIAWRDMPRFGATLCFIEVKTRQRDDGSAERATGREKQLRLLTAAKSYCIEQGIDIEQTAIQFEQISVFGNELYGLKNMKHYVIPID